MIFYFIPLLVIALSILGIIFIIGRKLPNLAAINIESISKETTIRVKNKILLDRLYRKGLVVRKYIKELLEPVKKNIADLAENLYQKTLELEKESLKKSQPLKKIDLVQGIKDKIEVIRKLMSDQDFKTAEDQAIAIIEIDNSNLDAYEILSEIYVEVKDYKKARETSRFLLKLLTKDKKNKETHRVANCYSDLGWVYQLEGKNNLALNNFKKAVELEPNNPRFLDLLLKISIILKDKNLANEAFNSLKEADPDNQKLGDLKEEIGSIEEVAS